MSYTETAANRLGAAYGGVSEDAAANFSFDDILGPLLELLLSLLSGCLGAGRTPAELVEIGKDPSTILRLRIRRMAVREGLDPGKSVQAIISTAKKSTPEEVAYFVSENIP